MTVTLTKAQHEPVRWDAAAEDLDWVLEGRPLWWDDASYIRYQSEDPEGYVVHELGFRSGDAPIVTRFVYFDYVAEAPVPSRVDRLAAEAVYEAEEAARQAVAALADAAYLPF